MRREPTVSAYWYAVGMVRDRLRLRSGEPLPPATYLVDDGDVALVIEVANDGKNTLTFSFDGSCPPTEEWAGTSDAG